ncbi:MAG TPA: peptide-methionine (R)-S-oxide reductase MsrB [Allosphingosinicella sp.]|jgi:peptide-methionine (R)-S-oxide reductase|nr:peptide-methionine (R)-S-oxide reductase MsrB [Allosphingosinicella sp.]
MKIGRRAFLGFGGLGLAAGGAFLFSRGEAEAVPTGNAPLRLADAEWRRRLSPEAYRVLRRAGTERAGSSPLDREHRRGTFHCAGCNLALFASADKFDSGTGWPSFTRPLAGAVGTREDNTLFSARTEVHCSRCAGHLGHVFDDGPRPTGKRYCMNGVAMRFVAA